MIAQYLVLCQEERFEPLSHETLYRILEVREASQRKALKRLDNVAAEGTAAFETLDQVVEKRLNQGKRYLKTDYKVLCKENYSLCADH